MTDTDTEEIREELDKMEIAYARLVQAAGAMGHARKCTCDNGGAESGERGGQCICPTGARSKAFVSK